MTEAESNRSAFSHLGAAMEDVRRARERLREEQHSAWTRYLEEVDRALSTELGKPDVARAVGTEDPIHALLDAVRGRIDDLRVQARLGAMEGEDLIEELREIVSDVVDRVRLPLR